MPRISALGAAQKTVLWFYDVVAKYLKNRMEYVTAINGIKGAAYAAATMCAVQNCGLVDMLMYYDARLYTPLTSARTRP